MQTRRAILLFAIVLGVAAIVSSIARPPERGGDATDQATAPVTRPADGTATATEPTATTPQPTTVEFRPGSKPPTREVEVGQPATVLVAVERAAQVDIPSLGLTDAAEPLTPALFEVLATVRGSHPILAQPAGSDRPPERVGTLKIVPPA